MVDNIQKGNGQWETALPLLSQLEEVIKQGDALAYSTGNIPGVFEDKFPGYENRDGLWAERSKLWTDTQLDTLRNILQAVEVQNRDFYFEQPFVEGMLAESNAAIGHMQVMQHGNALVAANVKQLAKLRQLVMSQINADTVYRAAETSRRAESEAKGVSWASRAPRTLEPMSANDPRGIGDFEFINPKRLGR
jgi:P-type conjugative transfer protein TrbJ